MSFQQSLARKTTLSGVGLHTGRNVTVELIPADVNFGIQFQRSDVVSATYTPAVASQISSTDLSTRVGYGENSISTIEHLMAAFVGLQIDNVLVRVSGPEIPIMDGSSQPFVEKIKQAGVATQSAHRRYLVVRKKFEMRVGDKYICIEPSDSTRFSCEIDFDNQVIGRQKLEYTASKGSFERFLSEARTFCHLREVEAMRKAGLALGGSLENAVVITDQSVLNEEGLRSHDEFVRHKLLDCIGDMALLGMPFVGKVTTYRSGHKLHADFTRELLAQKSEIFSIIEVFPERAVAIAAKDFEVAVRS